MNEGGLDNNGRRTLSALSSVDHSTIVNLWADPTTHRLLVDISSSLAFIDNEIVSGSGTTFTLAHTPTAGSEHIFAGRNRLYPITDYTISGAIVTTILSWSTGDILADYRY